MRREEVERLFRQYYGRMYGVACAILCDQQKSKDAVSTVFAQLLCRDGILLPTGAEERYLMACVRNQCLKSRLRDVLTEKAESTFAQNMAEAEDPEEDPRLYGITAAASSFSEQERRIFDLRFNAGLSYADIAQAEGISKVSVWKHLSHAINIIRDRFRHKGVVLITAVTSLALYAVATRMGITASLPETEVRHEAATASTPDASDERLHLYDNETLGKVLSDMAAHYGLTVTYRRAEAKDVRLYFRWNEADAIEQSLAGLNAFDRIDIEIRGNELIVK